MKNVQVWIRYTYQVIRIMCICTLSVCVYYKKNVRIQTGLVHRSTVPSSTRASGTTTGTPLEDVSRSSSATLEGRTESPSLLYACTRYIIPNYMKFSFCLIKDTLNKGLLKANIFISNKGTISLSVMDKMIHQNV